MIYTPFSLNGTWEMGYREYAYLDTEDPWESQTDTGIVEAAVPGYWEDMTESFLYTPFYRHLRINPEYGLQQYPISDVAPDMALPNILGNFFYRRTFSCRAVTAPAVLHFEGVQNAVSVWINGEFLGRHEGYSTPFDMEIPAGVIRDGDNTVVLSVSNHRLLGCAGEPVSGLTSRAANECTGGITGDVELRFYNCPLRDAALFVSEDCREITVKVESAEEAAYTWSVRDGDAVLKSGQGKGDLVFGTDGLKRWSPENPKLYTLTLCCGEGELTRSFGVRRLLPDGPHFRLNGDPYYLRGICEHCYFPETVHPAHDLTYYRSIIKAVKNLGFNFIRFHTYIPEEEYMQAADEMGMLLHVESPNNTTLQEWQQIVKFCRRHSSVVIYCCGNELQMDDPFIAHLAQCAREVHENTDALFSPMSAMRGLEYHFVECGDREDMVETPFPHNPRRLETVGAFSDMYSSYANARHSYESLSCDPEEIDAWSRVYGDMPRVSHEICIDGTYTDLSLADRYEGTRVGKTDMFSSIRRHLEAKGLLKKAPLYFKNSSEWQRRVRKYCFEAVRRSNNIAGYDFLGPIDTHWHTFGYDVGMMNEFYELKPGETVRNVRMYNSETVLLTDLGKQRSFAAGEKLQFAVYASHFGKRILEDAPLTVRLTLDGKVIRRESVRLCRVPKGAVTKLHTFAFTLPAVEKPGAMKLSVTLDHGELFAENEWELYLFPREEAADPGEVIVSGGMRLEELEKLLDAGKTVLLLGTEPFAALPTSFRIALAGRTAGNLATVVYDHPLLKDMPHEGFCGWQFAGMLEGGGAVCFETDAVPFDPIIEVASTHKFAIRQAALFEFRVAAGRLLVCALKLPENDPGALWLRNALISYARSEAFDPGQQIDLRQLHALASAKPRKIAGNTNLALNLNDKTAVRKK